MFCLNLHLPILIHLFATFSGRWFLSEIFILTRFCLERQYWIIGDIIWRVSPYYVASKSSGRVSNITNSFLWGILRSPSKLPSFNLCRMEWMCSPVNQFHHLLQCDIADKLTGTLWKNRAKREIWICEDAIACRMGTYQFLRPIFVHGERNYWYRPPIKPIYGRWHFLHWQNACIFYID